MKERFWRWLLLDDISFSVVLLAWFNMLWGGWLLLPLATFGTLPVAYKYMAAVAIEEVWGGWLVLLGVGIWVVHYRRWCVVTKILLAVGCATWTYITLSFILGFPTTTASVIYPLVTILYLRAYLCYAIHDHH